MTKPSINVLRAEIQEINPETDIVGSKKGYVIMMNGKLKIKENLAIIQAVLAFRSVSWYVISSTSTYTKNLDVSDVTSTIEFRL